MMAAVGQHGPWPVEHGAQASVGRQASRGGIPQAEGAEQRRGPKSRHGEIPPIPTLTPPTRQGMASLGPPRPWLSSTATADGIDS